MEFLDDDLLDPNESNDYSLHRTDDPHVWGLKDVARGRTPLVPTTIYAASGDSASGVEGLLFPSPWAFLEKAESNVGKSEVVEQDGESFEVLTVWDGAMPQPWFRAYVNETGLETTLRREHSKGLLLGNYAIQRAGPSNIHIRPTDATRVVKGLCEAKSLQDMMFGRRAA